MASTTEWLSLQQISDELDIPLRTLYAQRSRNEGPKGYKIGKHVRVRRNDLEAWIENHADSDRRTDAVA